MAYTPKDYYFHKAKAQNYVARSVFKIEEIDARFKIFKPGQKVLDLGAAPGSWSQYAAQKIGVKGKILGIDLQPIQLTISQATFLAADLRSLNLEEIMKLHGFVDQFDVVLSDMAPKTTGIRVTDQTRSFELSSLALDLALQFLKSKGHFVCKIFQSDEVQGYKNRLIANFARVEILRPKSTRKESQEIFFVALHKNSGGNSL